MGGILTSGIRGDYRAWRAISLIIPVIGSDTKFLRLSRFCYYPCFSSWGEIFQSMEFDGDRVGQLAPCMGVPGEADAFGPFTLRMRQKVDHVVIGFKDWA